MWIRRARARTLRARVRVRALRALRALQALRALRAWFTNNVARNFHVNLSNFKMWSLELQRLWAVLKTDRGELRARFGWGVDLLLWM